jgi:hypothetical protein
MQVLNLPRIGNLVPVWHLQVKFKHWHQIRYVSLF